MIQDKEKNTFGVLYAFTSRNPHTPLEIVLDNGEVFQAIFDTDYETDNGLEIDEKGYEEYHAMLLRRTDTGELFEISYKHFPRRILANGEVVVENRA